MLPVLCHCLTCEETNVAECLFIHPSRLELGISETGPVPCPKGHQAVSLCGAYKFDRENFTVELIDGVGLKNTRHVFRRLSQKFPGSPLPAHLDNLPLHHSSTNHHAPPVSPTISAETHPPQTAIQAKLEAMPIHVPDNRTPPINTSKKVASSLCVAFALMSPVVFRSELQEDIESTIASAEETRSHGRHHLDPQGHQQDNEFANVAEELRSAGLAQYDAAQLFHRLQIENRMRNLDQTDDGVPLPLSFDLIDREKAALVAFNEATIRAIEKMNEFVATYPGAWSSAHVYIPHYFNR